MNRMAARLYRALTRWLPGPVRREYGAEMEQTFVEQWTVARQSGRLAAFACWIRAMGDAARQIPREHWLVAGRYSHEDSMHNLLSDLRFAIRSFSRQRGATLLVVLTLTLAV
ncbi:MAG TPA: hypothetical protein VID74_01660, partial [Gemmatimonadales bacterium]